MSDTSQGPGWWLASDGKWYPPELWTGPPGARPDATAAPSALSDGSPGYPAVGSVPSPELGQAAQPGNAAPVGPSGYPGQAPVYPQQGYGGYGAPPSAGPYAGYGYQYAPSAAPAGRRTNGLAIASLVCGICGFLFLVPFILAIVFGFVARAQIRQSNGTQGGQGLATAGIILGFAWVALFVLIIVVSAVNTNTNGVVLTHLTSFGGLGG